MFDYTLFSLNFLLCIYVCLNMCVCLYLCMDVCDPQVQLFFESIKEQASQLRATQVALDNVQKNVLWVQRNLGTLRNWLDEQMK